MKGRFRDRVRLSTPQLEFLPREKEGRLRRGLSVDSIKLTDDTIVKRLENEQIQYEIENLKYVNMFFFFEKEIN